jgi:hypothetical protein
MLDQPMDDRAAGAAPYLAAFARVLGAAYHLRAGARDEGRARLAAHAAPRLLAEAGAEMAKARSGAAALRAIATEDIAA